MTVAPGFYRSFLRLAIANVVSNLMVPLAGLVDIAFLGHLDEIHHLAGVALATILFNFIYWSFGFLRMGTTGTTAQAVGRGDRSEVLLTGLRNVVLAVGISMGILLLQVPLRELGFALLSATDAVKASGLAYYNALIWGAPATLLNFVLLGWFLGRGRGTQVLLLSAVNNSSNVLLNYWLIVRLGWDSAGAGWGTALSQYLMALVGMGLVLWEIPWREWRSLLPKVLEGEAMRAAFLLNSDILIRTFSLVMTFSLFTNLSSVLGTTILAANTLLLQVLSFSAYFIDGIAFATESFAGQFHGRGDRPQQVRLIRLAGSLSLALGIGFALFFWLFPGQLFRLLTSHPDVIRSTQHYVVWLFPVLGFGSIAYFLDGYFLGLTAGRILRNSSLLATVVGFVPGAIAAWFWRSPQLLWLALSGFMATRAITLGLRVPVTLIPINCKDASN